MIAVATAASVSLTFIFAFTGWVAYLLWRHHSRVKANRVEHETRAIRFLASSHGILLGSLILGCVSNSSESSSLELTICGLQ